MNMLEKLLIFACIICVVKCDYYSSPSYSVEDVYATLDQTTEYLKNLSNAYKVLNDDDRNNVNDAITKYMKSTAKTIFQGTQRQRRSPENETQHDKDVNVLQDFKIGLHLTGQSFEDIAFFSIQTEDQLLWFAATLNSYYLQIYQLLANELKPVRTYPQQNGKRLIVHNYNADVLIVVETHSHKLIVLCFGKDKYENYIVGFKQELEIVEVTHTNMWHGMNKLHLGIASETGICIFVWLGEHFDRIDTLFFKARKLLSFQNKSFMHLVAVGFVTKIFRFSVQANKFLELQELHYADDISLFYFKRDHIEEHFLALSCNSLTVLYKEMYNRFVPFQRIPPTTFVHPLAMGNTVILLCTKENVAEMYQYNGWRFVKLQIKLSNVRQIRQIRSAREDTLIVQDQEGWKLLKPIWASKKAWRSLQSEVNLWCNKVKQKVFERMLEKMPDVKNPVISNGHVDHLRVRNLNGYNSNELIRLTQQYKNVITKFNLTNNLLKQGIRGLDRSNYTVLHGRKIAVKCSSNCYVRNLKTDTGIKPIAKYRQSEPIEILRFTQLKVKAINDWKCPVPNPKIDDVFVSGTINGMSMQTLQKETLKISGDQEILAKHTFLKLNATNASMSLDIATSSTRQLVWMREARVKELHLTEDEFFLPLNGPTTVMSGSITAPRITVTRVVYVRGTIKGKGSDQLTPIKEIFAPMVVPNDCFLQNVTLKNLVNVKDIVGTREVSLKNILKNGVPLNSDMPVHLILSSNRTQWNNVTLRSDMDYVTKNSIDVVVISGTKFANNVTLTDAAYANIPIPKLTIPLRAMGVISSEIRTSSIAVGNLTVKNLNVSHVLGADDLNNIFFDSVSSLHNIDFSTKLFTGQVVVKNVSTLKIKDTNVRDLNIQMDKWIDVDHLKGPVNVMKLVVDTLKTPAAFNFPLPVRVKDVFVEADSTIGKINTLDTLSFMENVMKVDEMISLGNVTFMHGFTANHTRASYPTLNLSPLDAHPNLRSKRISTTLETNAINIPQNFGYSASNVSSTFIIQGSVNFLAEPIVQNVNDVNLKQLSENLWMLNQDTIVSGININLKNMTLAANVIIDANYINSFSIKMWSDLSKRLLSKTEEQHIRVISSFRNVEVPAIIAANTSNLRCTDPNLNDILTNSLMRNQPQTVNAAWRFHELDINDMHWNGKLNNINLNTDIVRYDAKQNIIIAEKKISSLMTKDLWLSHKNFSNFVSNAVTKNCQKLYVIKGQKIFDNITLNNLSIKGTIMGRSIETALLKSGNQIIFGIKKIRGHLNAPALITDSVVNDVNLTELTNQQLKKHKAVQVIESTFDFRNDLEIFGNVTIGGSYEKINLRNIHDESGLDDVLSKTTKVTNVAENVATALQNHAVYVSKFEIVDTEDVLGIISDMPGTKNIIDLKDTYLCESLSTSTLCNDTKLSSIITDGNTTAFIMKKLVLLDDVAFLVIASSDFISIYSYVIAEEQLYKTELYVPGVLQASVEPIDNSLWIVLRLPEQTLLLNYQLGGEYKQYVLPASDAFVISKMPNKQHLLIRSDGMWSLGGVGHPKHLFRMPLQGQIQTFIRGTDYYVKVASKNNTVVLKAQYIGN